MLVIYCAARFFIKDPIQKKNLIVPIELTEEEKREIEEIRKNRTEKQGKKFNDISEILFRYDPIGLDFDTNIDEYDYEADLILKELPNQETVEQLTETIHAIFIKCFDNKLAKERDLYKHIAQEIWLLK